MRLPFPTRISVQKTFIFAGIVFFLQLLEHTDPIFGMLFFAYIMLSVLAFNLAGGFSRASGSYVFWFAALTCIIGGLWKVVLREPADSNLLAPRVTMGVYVVGMVMIMVSLFISHRFTRNSGGLPSLLHTDRVNLGLASLGCLIANQLTVLANEYLPGGNGSLTAIINQENVFLPVAILLGTIHTIRTSGGRRSVNVVTAYASLALFFEGMTVFSKQGMLTPVVCWSLAAASQRYRLRIWQVGLLIAFAIWSVMILSPLSQVGRAIVPDSANTWERAQLAVDLLTHPRRLRAQYKQATQFGDSDTTAHFAAGYFDTPQGLLDRLNIIGMDDRLVNYTLQGHEDGYQRMYYYFINLIPHVIFPNKEKYAPPGGSNSGNYYAHEIGGLLSPDDFGTGVSFSPLGEAFHLQGWIGVLLLAPVVWILVFTVVDLVAGDLRTSPFGLMAAVEFAHVAPESLLGGLILFGWTGSLAILIATVFCTYFAPILGALLAVPQEQMRSSAPEARLRPSEASAG
jgi:hypothetical protein